MCIRDSKNNALHSFAHADGHYHLMGCMLSAASCNKWWAEEILHTDDFAAEQKDITKLGENHVFYLPYLMGERSPHNDPYAREMCIRDRSEYIQKTRSVICSPDQIVIGAGIQSLPVSYTHLDVYKRQDIEGAYTMINQQFVEHEIAGKYKYTNREDDVGEEGLRKAKLSYKPVFMVEKGVVTLNEDSEKECAKDDI